MGVFLSERHQKRVMGYAVVIAATAITAGYFTMNPLRTTFGQTGPGGGSPTPGAASTARPSGTPAPVVLQASPYISVPSIPIGVVAAGSLAVGGQTVGAFTNTTALAGAVTLSGASGFVVIRGVPTSAVYLVSNSTTLLVPISAAGTAVIPLSLLQ